MRRLHVRRRSPGRSRGLTPVSIWDCTRANAIQQLFDSGGAVPAHPNHFGRLAALGEGATAGDRPGLAGAPASRASPCEARLHHPFVPTHDFPAIERADRPDTAGWLRIRASASLMGCSCGLEAGVAAPTRIFSAAELGFRCNTLADAAAQGAIITHALSGCA